MSAIWLDTDVADSEADPEVELLQDWLAEGKRSIIIPAVGKEVSGSIAHAATQERIKPNDVSYYTSVPTADEELLADRDSTIEKLRYQVELASCLGAKYFIFQRAGSLADPDLMSFCHIIAKACSPDYAICRDQLVIKCDVATDWELWKCMSKFLPHIRLCLALTSDYGWLDDKGFEKMMKRWSAEQVTMILCLHSSVKLNQTGQPSMSKRNREVVLNLGIARNAAVVFQVDKLDVSEQCLESEDSGPTMTTDVSLSKTMPTGWTYVNKMLLWLKYIHHKYCEVSRDDAMQMAYSDILQEPLQPLGSNLTLQQYSVFEEDKVKYAMYKAAIREKLLPLLTLALSKAASPEIRTPADESSGDALNSRKTVPLHIAYLGGGRGPLLDKCFEVLREEGWAPSEDGAIVKDDRKLEVHFSLVEKNPAAVILLRANIVRTANSDWWKNVEIVERDMREWAPALPVSLAFSELLGSIGDNELAPECMDLKCATENTILIPRTSTSYFLPISSHKLFNLARPNQDTGYVCNIVTFAPLSTILAPAFTFDYTFKVKQTEDISTPATALGTAPGIAPMEEGCTSTARCEYARLKWVVAAGQDNWLHGFSGYFQAELTEEINLSTCPGNATAGLHSWYPMYLPINEAIWCRSSDKIQLDIWRCSDYRRVWYEWIASVKSPNHSCITSRIHNLNGSGWSISK